MKIFVKNKSFRGGKKKSELGQDGIKYLKKLASKFDTAIEKRAGGVKISQVGDGDDKKEKSEVVNVRRAKSKDQSSIREQLKNSLEMLSQMEPVADVKSENLSKKKWKRLL